jgi:hypothetical protein
MPKPANLNSKDIDEIVYYLEYMANQAITRIRIQFTLDITTASRLRHFFSFRPKESHMRII